MKKLLQYALAYFPLFILSAIVYTLVVYIKNGHVAYDIEYLVGVLSTMAVAYFSLTHLSKKRQRDEAQAKKSKKSKRKN